MSDDAVGEMVVDRCAAEISYAGKLPGRGWRWPQMVSDNTGLHAFSAVVLHSLMAYLGFGAEMGGVAEFSRKVDEAVQLYPESGATEAATLKKMLQMLKQRKDGDQHFDEMVVALSAKLEQAKKRQKPKGIELSALELFFVLPECQNKRKDNLRSSRIYGLSRWQRRDLNISCSWN